MIIYLRLPALIRVVFFTLKGECDWLVPTAQEHRPANELQREARSREAENRPVNPSHDLCAADAQQGHSIELDSHDGVCCLHLSQQVSGTSHGLEYVLLWIRLDLELYFLIG